MTATRRVTRCQIDSLSETLTRALERSMSNPL